MKLDAGEGAAGMRYGGGGEQTDHEPGRGVAADLFGGTGGGSGGGGMYGPLGGGGGGASGDEYRGQGLGPSQASGRGYVQGGPGLGGEGGGGGDGRINSSLVRCSTRGACARDVQVREGDVRIGHLPERMEQLVDLSPRTDVRTRDASLFLLAARLLAPPACHTFPSHWSDARTIDPPPLSLCCMAVGTTHTPVSRYFLDALVAGPPARRLGPLHSYREYEASAAAAFLLGVPEGTAALPMLSGRTSLTGCFEREAVPPAMHF